MTNDCATAAAAAAADWSELHGDLLDHIVQKVRFGSPLCDYIRFGAVCTNWRWVHLRNYDDTHDGEEEEEEEKHREMIKFPDQTPVLLIPYPSAAHSATLADNDDDEEDFRDRFYNPKDTWLGLDHTRLEKPTRTIYSLYSRKVHTDIQLPVPYFLNCRGTSYGWIVAIEEDEDFSVRLLNPFRSVDNEIQLPPLTTLALYYDDETLREIIDSGYFLSGSYFLRKAVVSANPSSVCNQSELVVMIFYDHYNPALCRPGDATWTTLPNVPYVFEDAVVYKGQFYAIEHSDTSRVVAFDVSSFSHDDHSLPEFTNIASLPINVRNEHVYKKYLVECAGDLLQVRRDIVDDTDAIGSKKTIDFQVFKLDMLSLGSNEWVEIHTLDGRSLFLGGNASTSVLAPVDGHGCKPNRIYFTDDYEELFIARPSFGPRHMGVYNLEDGSFEPHYQDLVSRIIMPNAIWIQPML